MISKKLVFIFFTQHLGGLHVDLCNVHFGVPWPTFGSVLWPN